MVLFGPLIICPSTTEPLTLKDFAHYFLIPHLIGILIADNMNLDISDTVDVCKQSDDIGNVLMALSVPSEGLLDAILEENTRRCQGCMTVDSDIAHDAVKPDVNLRAGPKEHTTVVRALFLRLTITLTHCPSTQPISIHPPHMAERGKHKLVSTAQSVKTLSVVDYPVQTVKERRRLVLLRWECYLALNAEILSSSRNSNKSTVDVDETHTNDIAPAAKSKSKPANTRSKVKCAT